MSNYQIMRVEKVKSAGALAAASKHNRRERETPNADRSRLHANSHIGLNSTEAILGRMREIHSDLAKAPRKDSVLAGQYVVTASPEKMNSMSREEQDQYFSAALNFVRERHGPQNILAATIHRDETTPHMHVLFVPVTDRNTLSFKEFYGGRQKLRDLQTDFHEKVSKDFDMGRGVERSRAKHQTIQRWYSKQAEAERGIDGAQLGRGDRIPEPPDRKKLREIQKEHKCSKDEALLLYGRSTMRVDALQIVEKERAGKDQALTQAADREYWKNSAMVLGVAIKTFGEIQDPAARADAVLGLATTNAEWFRHTGITSQFEQQQAAQREAHRAAALRNHDRGDRRMLVEDVKKEDPEQAKALQADMVENKKETAPEQSPVHDPGIEMIPSPEQTQDHTHDHDRGR